MVLALLIEELRDECESAEDVEDDGHKAIPPTEMLAVDGTKMIMTCAVSLHNNLIAYVLEEIVERDVT